MLNSSCSRCWNLRRGKRWDLCFQSVRTGACLACAHGQTTSSGCKSITGLLLFTTLTHLTFSVVTTMTVKFLTFISQCFWSFCSENPILPFRISALWLDVLNGAGDCYDEHGNKGFCASGAINNFTSQLTQFHLQQQSRPLLTKARGTECECRCFLTSTFGLFTADRDDQQKQLPDAVSGLMSNLCRH